jgi:uncharacterized protein YyaL (SSP411 family)
MTAMANRLAHASSPYLRQHADNPVDWYPWGADAFERARLEQKPIFLSVGYATCHWCHVMAHESFEDAAVAAVLNELFVSVKVDREERPDVDRVYMLFVQATTGQGGWPMSVWLTPALEPFYGGTYFPPASRFGRPAFVDVLHQIGAAWRDEREKVTASASSLTARLREATRAMPPPGDESGVRIAPREALAEGALLYAQAFDHAHGGFGGAPKFPRPSELFFLLRQHALGGDEQALEMSLETLRSMALGGMRDHLGGGFHRYAVDAAWRVPHFEKMLYDQAQIVLALLEGGQASRDPFYGSVAEDTLAYVRRSLTAPEGGFFSAEDADSIPADEVDAPHPRSLEGAFYLWSIEEVEAVVGPELAALVVTRFGLRPGGNAHDPQGEFRGRNVLYTALDLEGVAEASGLPMDEVIRGLRKARQALFEARRRRPAPALDDKIVTAWNGLTIAAFARAARVLRGQSPQVAEWLTAAERAAHFLRTTLWDRQTNRLRRSWRAGVVGVDAFAEDYACVVWGALELFQATGDVVWLTWAFELQDRLDEDFWDETAGGWFSTSGEDPSVLLRMKEDYDGAEPSASAVAVHNLLTIAHLTGDARALTRIERTLARGGLAMGASARAVPFMLANLATYHATVRQIVIVGAPGTDDTQALHAEVARRYLPFAVVVPVDPRGTHEALGRHLPFVASLGTRDGRATAYVCEGFVCHAPTTEPEELGRLLDAAEVA